VNIKFFPRLGGHCTEHTKMFLADTAHKNKHAHSN